MSGVRVGGVAIKRVAVGLGSAVVGAKRIMAGVGGAAVEVWSSFTSSGMDKSGTQSVAASTTARITGFVARADFAGPTGDALVITGSGVVNVVARLTLTANSSYPPTLQIRKNGVSVATAAVASFSSVANISTTLTVAAGDNLELWIVTAFAGAVTVQTGSTYLYFTL